MNIIGVSHRCQPLARTHYLACAASRSEDSPRIAPVSCCPRQKAGIGVLARRSQLPAMCLAQDVACGRVEEERGDVQVRRRRWRATSFVAALAEKTIIPFLLPAHRTGRADFPHPALGRVSRQGMRRLRRGQVAGDRTPRVPNTSWMGNGRYPGPASLCRRRRKRRTV